jgi:TRAP-type C4-dicarboxylate transport system substrate-binding protein
MKQARYTVTILVALVLAVSLFAAACAQPVPAPKPAPAPAPTPAPAPKVDTITINWASFQPGTMSETVTFKNGFMAKATELSKGRLAFNFKGGPETIPAFDLGKAVQSGVVDLGMAPVGFYEALAPGIGGAMLRKVSLDEERKPGGAYDYLVSLTKPGGLYYLGRLVVYNDLDAFFLFLNKKIEKQSDFNGFRIGTATGSRAATEGWGATVVSLAMSDYYTAMERGTVDGVAGSSISNWVTSGCQAVTKYMMKPGYFDSTASIFMRLETWNKLPADIQKIITDSMIYHEKYSMTVTKGDADKAMEKINEAKVQVYTLAPDVAKWFTDTANEATWKFQQQRFPDVTPKLKALLSGS